MSGGAGRRWRRSIETEFAGDAIPFYANPYYTIPRYIGHAFRWSWENGHGAHREANVIYDFEKNFGNKRNTYRELNVINVFEETVSEKGRNTYREVNVINIFEETVSETNATHTAR